MEDSHRLRGREPANNQPAPYVFPPSQEWFGNDGSWSTFVIRVGTPEQEFHILPATNTQETWVPLPQACPLSNLDTCVQSRGIAFGQSSSHPGFTLNQSSTWAKEGIYNLLSEANLGYAGNGDYGFDNVSLGLDATGATLSHQVVAGIVTDDFWLGTFGLGPKPANFSDYNSPVPSYMTSLVEKNIIPSLSYGYTAGAKHRLDGVPGSLTLGGYDQARFIPNNVSFSFASDDSRSLTLAIESITASNTWQGNVTALSTGILALIDSTVPHIWLPLSACEIFEKAFDLAYDKTTDLYLINDTHHAYLQQVNPTVTFCLGNTISGGETVNIDVPYKAFDLQASSPLYANATNYFPLRRAANESQYTLGRTFLQEAYVIADYERKNFSISQTVFRNDNTSQIIAIPSANSTSGTEASSTTSSSGLKPGQIAGIIIGALAIIALLSILFLLRHLRKRRRARRQAKLSPRSSELELLPSGNNSLSANKSYTRDLSNASTELPAYDNVKNAHSTFRQSKPRELLGSPAATELESPYRVSHSPTLDEHLRVNR